MIYINLLIILLVIIFIHELGHYTCARLFKIRVTDFSIGFGKVLYQIKDKNLTNWKISLIPLGGYVKIKGLESIFQNSKINDNEFDSFQNINLFKKILILISGSLFNIISAWICVLLILFFFGIVSFSPIIGKVIENSPAEINGLIQGDKIININNNYIENFSDISLAIKNTKRVKIDIIRNNNIINKEFDLYYNESLGKYIIGITSNNDPIILKYHFLLSLKQSINFVPKYYIETFKYLNLSYSNKTLSKEIAGPIGIVKMADKLMLDKIKGIFLMFITISLFVSLFNLLPIPFIRWRTYSIFYYSLNFF